MASYSENGVQPTSDPTLDLSKDGPGRSKLGCYVFSAAKNDTIPIYHWQNKANPSNIFYSNSPSEGITLEKNSIFTNKGIAFHLLPKEPLASPQSYKASAAALIRWSQPRTSQTSYTINTSSKSGPPLNKSSSILGYTILSSTPSLPGTIILPLPVFFPTSQFTYDALLTDDQRYTLQADQEYAYQRATTCTLHLTPEQRATVLPLYDGIIQHSITTTPNVNAEAFVGGRQIWVNVGIFFALSRDERAQTLLHEMMHCAGHRHPVRTAADMPGDGGAYYGSVPLQAEMCIAGVQSLTGVAAGLQCPVID